MSSVNSDLNNARRKLTEALGDDMKHYLLILKSWFRQNISREEFDYDARKLIPNEYLHLHNQFLLAILAKCQSLGSSLGSKETVSQILKAKKLKNRKRPAPKSGFNQRFVPSDALKSVPQTVVKSPEEEGGVSFCSREMTLPDMGMLHGRLLVAAWETGLEDVTDNVANLLKIALENLLKNIISTVLCRRNAYRRREKRFKYTIGAEIPRVFLRNTVNLTEDDDAVPVPSSTILPSQYERVEMDRASELACAADAAPGSRSAVNLYDMLQTMQQCKPCLASHTIYSTSVERILQRLWHPSHEELDQEEIYRQEKVVKQEMELQQSISKVDWNKPPP